MSALRIVLNMNSQQASGYGEGRGAVKIDFRNAIANSLTRNVLKVKTILDLII